MTQNPDLFHEKELWQAFPLIAGLDEAGRGALAGPVCVGTVILPRKHPHLLRALSRARDSKQLTPRQRTDLVPLIQQIALAHGIGFAPSEEIDRLGIVPATRLAASRALESIHILPDYLLTDFRLELPELDIPQTAIVKGDARSLSIACASILAKTARDEYMRGLDGEYPQYHFARHKGYGTLLHRKKILELGHSPVHRKTFQIKK
ncbi:MAG: ribonuclease HII [Anaerolineales bacterium]|jgi:ribonuclease HII|nr:ribonuclease HII [Chloroflexota bacterium]MCC6984908.1 ribonuclease HII [Anaerolineales bacterium]